MWVGGVEAAVIRELADWGMWGENELLRWWEYFTAKQRRQERKAKREKVEKSREKLVGRGTTQLTLVALFAKKGGPEVKRRRRAGNDVDD